MRINGQKSSSSTYCRGTENQLSLELGQLMPSPTAELNGSGAQNTHCLVSDTSQKLSTPLTQSQKGGGAFRKDGSDRDSNAAASGAAAEREAARRALST